MAGVCNWAEINKRSLYEQIDGVARDLRDNVVCNSLLAVVSSAVSSDKRLIGKYEDAEVYTAWVLTAGGRRQCRVLTPKGVARYVHEGKIIDYANTCGYFNLDPKDRVYEELAGLVEEKTGELPTRAVLKWLFQKTKECKALGKSCTPEDLLGHVGTAGWGELIEDRRLQALAKLVGKK
jgi:hypothetical protein